MTIRHGTETRCRSDRSRTITVTTRTAAAIADGIAGTIPETNAGPRATQQRAAMTRRTLSCGSGAASSS